MKVLVVDDEPEILSIISKWLAGRGHEALPTSDPQQMMSLIDSGNFDVVLLDLVMPQASGLNFISRIHASKPRLPVIVMSVIDDPRVAVLAAKEGIEEYITKPIDFDNLEQILSRLASRTQRPNYFPPPADTEKD